MSNKLLRNVLVSLATTVLLTAGCSKPTLQRKDVWGTVTWKGQLVPSGAITFEPDSSKGNKGPMGFAIIQEGKFDTRSIPTLKGCIAGANKVLIVGGDNKNRSESNPYGNSLFTPYATTIEIPENGGEVNLTVQN